MSLFIQIVTTPPFAKCPSQFTTHKVGLNMWRCVEKQEQRCVSWCWSSPTSHNNSRVRSTPCNTKEAKANREAESNEKMAIVKLLHFGASWRLQHLANVCELFKSTLNLSRFGHASTSSVLTTPKIMFALHAQGLLCTCVCTRLDRHLSVKWLCEALVLLKHWSSGKYPFWALPDYEFRSLETPNP